MNKTILLAEDDRAIIEVVKIILEGEGHVVLQGVNEDEVMEILKKNEIHLILLDIGLGGTDGIVLAKKIKNNNSTSHIPIIIVSANNEVESKAKNAGVDGFLAKPFELDALINVIKQKSI